MWPNMKHRYHECRAFHIFPCQKYFFSLNFSIIPNHGFIQPLLVSTVFCWRLNFHIYNVTHRRPYGEVRRKFLKIDTSTLLCLSRLFWSVSNLIKRSTLLLKKCFRKIEFKSRGKSPILAQLSIPIRICFTWSHCTQYPVTKVSTW